MDKVPECVINCSGCTGSITLEYKKIAKIKQAIKADKNQSNIGAIANLLSKFSIFQSIDEHNLKDLIPFLKLRKFAPNDLIIKKGDAGRNLFIVASGKVEVLNEDEISMSVLEKGEVFGEMSLISGNPVGVFLKNSAEKYHSDYEPGPWKPEGYPENSVQNEPRLWPTWLICRHRLFR